MKFAAQALSTPPRLCLLTGVRLPSYFLIPFGVAKHPETGAPWHLPRLFDSSKASGASAASPVSSSSPKPNSALTSHKPIRTATGTHFVASCGALAYVSSLSKSTYRRLLPYRWKEDPSLKIPDIIWRQDMAAFVLGMLQKRVVRDLEYLASRPAAYVVACKSHYEISAHAQIGAILWLGPSHDQLDGAINVEEQGPPQYAMHRYRGHYIPYFNLVTLLGRTNLLTLRKTGLAQIGDQIAVLKAKRPTVKTQLELWKLLGFLAQATVENPEKK